MVCTLDGRQVPTQWAWEARSRFFQTPSLYLDPVAEWLWPWVWGVGWWMLEGCHSSVCHGVSAESLAIHTSLLSVSQHPPLWPQFPHFVGLPVFPVYRYHYQEQHFPGELRSKKTFLKNSARDQGFLFRHHCPRPFRCPSVPRNRGLGKY